MPPNCRTVDSTRARTEASSAMSQAAAETRPPSRTMAAATLSAAAPSRSATSTAAPSRPSRCAVAAPMPEPPPMTIKTLPDSLDMRRSWGVWRSVERAETVAEMGVDDPVRALRVEPAVDPGPVVGVHHVFAGEAVQIVVTLLPDMGPGAGAGGLRHPAQPPRADRGDVARHRQQLALEAPHRRFGDGRLHRQQQGAVDAGAIPVAAALALRVGHAVDVVDRIPRQAQAGGGGIDAAKAQQQVAAVVDAGQGRSQQDLRGVGKRLPQGPDQALVGPRAGPQADQVDAVHAASSRSAASPAM